LLDVATKVALFQAFHSRPHQPGGDGGRSNAHSSGVPSLGREPWTTVSLGHSVLRFYRSDHRLPRAGAQCRTVCLGESFAAALFISTTKPPGKMCDYPFSVESPRSTLRNVAHSRGVVGRGPMRLQSRTSAERRKMTVFQGIFHSEGTRDGRGPQPHGAPAGRADRSHKGNKEDEEKSKRDAV